MGATSIDKVKERVHKLLNQAADQEGSPEGETFYRKAFELMANYGFEERDLARPDDDVEVMRKQYSFSGTYTDMQARLFADVAGGLHCVVFYNKNYGGTSVNSATVFGVRSHVERLDVLYSLLLPQMLAGARYVKGDPAAGLGTVVARRSYMRGFSATIFERLCAAESAVAESSDGYSLALISDYEKACDARDAFAAEQGLFLTPERSAGAVHCESFAMGASDAAVSDLGQTRVRARPALPF